MGFVLLIERREREKKIDVRWNWGLRRSRR